MIYLFLAFIIKHFVCDFLIQLPYHYLNKGKYGHLGGVSHALIHGLGSALCLAIFDLPFVGLALLDAALHYHIDWAKMNLCQRYNLKPDNGEGYWYLLGLDQMLHYLTYIFIIGISYGYWAV